MKHLHYKRGPPVGRHSSSCFLLAFFSSTLLCCSAGSSNAEMLRGWVGGSSSSISRHLLQTTTNGKVPVVIAEGGAQYLYPEMTMRAYRAAMDGGADFLTCMLAITSDQKAFCHPTFELTKFTNINNNATLVRRQFKFLQKTSLYSFSFTLDEIKSLRVAQTKPEGRTKAFDFVFPVATPEELIAEINARAANNKTAKRVGIILEISNGTLEMEKFEIKPTPTTYALDLLKKNNWTSPSSPAMVISKMKSQLAQFVEAGVMVKRLFRFLPNGDKTTQIGDDLVSLPDQTTFLQSISGSATGVMFPVGSSLLEGLEDFWGMAIPRVTWNGPLFAAAQSANLSSYVYGFVESDWSSSGSRFNTFLADQVTMYRSLLFGNISSLVTGVATDWPAAAAKTAACYAAPLSVIANGTGIKTLASNRPLVISSGGSTALLPAHTNLAFMQAVRDGADFIDCTLQVSKDGVLFCLESMQLSKYTDVDEKFPGRNKVYNTDSSGDGLPDFWSFDFTWAEIKTLKVSPRTRNNNAIGDSPRPTFFYKVLPPISFNEWIGIARNATRTVGIYIKIDNPTFTNGKGIAGQPESPWDQISLMLAKLKEWGYITPGFLYNRSVAPPLLIASADSCGLRQMFNISSGTLPLVQRTGSIDSCEAATLEKQKQNKPAWWVSKPGLAYIDSYGGGISPTKRSLVKVNNGSTGTPLDGVIVVDSAGPNTVVADAQAEGLKVYPRPMRNDMVPGDTEGAYDFLSDPTMELQYYFDQLKVDALESQFVSTAIGFLQSSCRARPDGQVTDPRFTISEVHPGELAAEINAVVIQNTESVISRDGDSVRRKSVIASVTTVAFVMLVALSVLLFFAYRRTKKRRADKLFRDDLGSLGNLPMLRIFGQNELIVATNNFTEANRLGKGGFGTVYKAVLPDGVIVAVKKLHVELKANESLRSDVSVRQLINEVEIIGTVHNRNVVPLQGVCMDKELLLVYDYMPNGSLQEAIFDPDYAIKLNWAQWYNIAVGTAKGLAYLHEECEQKIIHRDIKPANILLDAQLNPRVADFGLARNVEVDDTHVTTKVMGSIGYMAPDYATTGQLTERSDTYSFGILLLTIITGRKPITLDGSEESCTLEWVKKKAQDGLEELLTVISPRFEGKYDPGEATRWLYTALLCAQNEPALRPSMGDVVQMLSGKREVPSICVAPATVVFPDYSRTSKASHQSNDSNSKLSYSGTPTTSTLFENSGIYPGTLDDSVIFEGR